MRPIYLDNLATTRLDPRALAAMMPFLTDDFGNPASRTHAFGSDAADAVERARTQVAELIGALGEEIIFTSGATESNCTAIFGCVRHKQRGHLITSRIEHKSVLETFKTLEKSGFDVTYLTPDHDGIVSVSTVLAALRPDTLLVSVMLVNNEIGSINPIADIGHALTGKGVVFHCDAAQGVSKLPFDVHAAKVDMLSISAHKMHGPKGIGALFITRRMREVLVPLMRGGGQESGLRGGTLNVPGIVGFGAAAALARQELAQDSARVMALRERLLQRLLAGVPDLIVNGSRTQRVANNLSVSFKHADGEQLLVAVRERIALSSGSACAAGSHDISHVLQAIGADERSARNTLRFGLSRFTTEDDVDRAADIVIEAALATARPPSPAAPVTSIGNGLTAVAVVKNDIIEPKYIPWGEVQSQIVVDPQWRESLNAIEDYSHLLIVYWMHHVDTYKQRHVCQGRYDVCPSVGMFASRSPYRVNPIGVTTVRLLSVKDGVLTVSGLDAVNGTPVLDIKPYTPRIDAPLGAVTVPAWIDQLVF